MSGAATVRAWPLCGDPPWVEVSYRVRITGGQSALRWLNKLASLGLRRIIFQAGGNFRRACDSQPLKVAGLELRWRWEEAARRVVIDFLGKGGKALSWRWDELSPGIPGAEAEGVPDWAGVAHVGGSSYTYSLTPSQDTPGNSPSKRPNHESLVVESGSFCEASWVESEEGTPLPDIGSRYRQDLQSEHLQLREVLELVDGMWLQELNLQSTAELYNFVLEAAAEVQEGAEPQQVISCTLVRAQEVRGWALESLRIRAGVRTSRALGSSLQELEGIVMEACEAALQGAEDLLRQLEPNVSAESKPEQQVSAAATPEQQVSAAAVQVTARKVLSNLQEELDSISLMKEANTETVMQLGEHLEELKREEWAFASGVLEAAKANPESLALCRRAAKTLRGVLRKDAILGAANRPDQQLLRSCEDLVLGMLRDHEADAALRSECRAVLEALRLQSEGPESLRTPSA
ncbi:unnamed protein product [Polarella glacialis]|uniref:Uncharacterized protein n=1 Tax=Polarella glacialis TaxID=89957 RepID=A0A813GLZ6_POLGL|nr:unnamed protein product [Polarella glacialis]